MLPPDQRREYKGKRKPRPRKSDLIPEKDMPKPKVHPDYRNDDDAWEALVRMSRERGQ